MESISEYYIRGNGPIQVIVVLYEGFGYSRNSIKISLLDKSNATCKQSIGIHELRDCTILHIAILNKNRGMLTLRIHYADLSTNNTV